MSLFMFVIFQKSDILISARIFTVCILIFICKVNISYYLFILRFCCKNDKRAALVSRIHNVHLHDSIVLVRLLFVCQQASKPLTIFKVQFLPTILWMLRVCLAVFWWVRLLWDDGDAAERTNQHWDQLHLLHFSILYILLTYRKTYDICVIMSSLVTKTQCFFYRFRHVRKSSFRNKFPRALNSTLIELLETFDAMLPGNQTLHSPFIFQPYPITLSRPHKRAHMHFVWIACTFRTFCLLMIYSKFNPLYMHIDMNITSA